MESESDSERHRELNPSAARETDGCTDSESGAEVSRRWASSQSHSTPGLELPGPVLAGGCTNPRCVEHKLDA